MDTLKITLAAARVNAKMTQADTAKAMQVSKNTICNWESGKKDPKPAEMYMLSHLYGIPVENIFLPSETTKS